ncbi:MAG: hypothetical protein LKF96_11690 [Treponema sp.]|jgi:hypothetical protein|nr:hypothetical protein [Treponema sp.]
MKKQHFPVYILTGELVLACTGTAFLTAEPADKTRSDFSYETTVTCTYTTQNELNAEIKEAITIPFLQGISPLMQENSIRLLPLLQVSY